MYPLQKLIQKTHKVQVRRVETDYFTQSETEKY